MLARTVPWRPARPLEVGVILDLAVLVPVLYGICYRRRGRAAWVRAAALACLGIWLAGRVIPAAHHELLDHLSPLRYAGMAVLSLVELSWPLPSIGLLSLPNLSKLSAPWRLPSRRAFLAGSHALWRGRQRSGGGLGIRCSDGLAVAST